MGPRKSTYTCDRRGPPGDCCAPHRPGLTFAVGDIASFCSFPLWNNTHDMASNSADPTLMIQVSKSGVDGAGGQHRSRSMPQVPFAIGASAGYQIVTKWRTQAKNTCFHG